MTHPSESAPGHPEHDPHSQDGRAALARDPCTWAGVGRARPGRPSHREPDRRPGPQGGSRVPVSGPLRDVGCVVCFRAGIAEQNRRPVHKTPGLDEADLDTTACVAQKRRSWLFKKGRGPTTLRRWSGAGRQTVPRKPPEQHTPRRPRVAGALRARRNPVTAGRLSPATPDMKRWLPPENPAAGRGSLGAGARSGWATPCWGEGSGPPAPASSLRQDGTGQRGRRGLSGERT